jgi:predicted lipoprotein with Yx(FWY)xxD motif
MNRKDGKRFIRLSGIVVIFALILAACAPSAPAGQSAVRLRSGIPTSSNPIPITGSTATPTPSPSATATTRPSPMATATRLPTQPPLSSGPAVMLGNKSGLGNFLVDSRGMTLYIFKNDTVGVSNCGPDCASAWPALAIKTGLTPTGGPGVTGKLGVTKRSDGTQQVTYNGWPLYYFSGDTQPGDSNGQGIGGLWFVAPLAAGQPAQPTLPPVYPTVVPGGGY